MDFNHILGVVGLGLLFAIFAAMHLWRGDQNVTSCSGDGKCGECSGEGQCRDEEGV